MKKIWNFLSGKKTIIGLALMELSHTSLAGDFSQLMYIVGGALAGTGLVHKGFKGITNPNTDQK